MSSLTLFNFYSLLSLIFSSPILERNLKTKYIEEEINGRKRSEVKKNKYLAYIRTYIIPDFPSHDMLLFY
jgi:hypothetical protein